MSAAIDARDGTADPAGPAVAVPPPSRRRALLRAPTLIDLGILAALLLLALTGPANVLTLAVLGLAVALFVRRPAWSVPIALVLAFTTFPAAVPVEFPVGSTTAQAFEPFLAVATIWTLCTRRAPRWVDALTLVLLAVLLAGSAYGVLQHNPTAKVIFDVRPMGHLIATIAVVARIGPVLVEQCRRLLPWILWFSAVMTALASATGFAITGSAEQATLYLGDATSDATRLRGPTTDLALTVVCACLVLYLLGRCRRYHVLAFLIPSFIIVFLAFSRYTVLGVGFALVFGLLAARSWRGLLNAVLLAGALILIGTGIGAASPKLSALPGGAYVVTQVSGFESRVLGGLTGQVIAEDGSAQYRLSEDGYLLPSIAAAPFVGHGFGYAYKPPATQFGAVADDYAPYYSHNYYLWILDKTGLFAATAFLGAILLPIALALRRRDTATLMLATALGVLMVASFVAPMPNSDTSATLVGTALGLLVVHLSPAAPPRRRTGVVRRRSVREAAPEG